MAQLGKFFRTRIRLGIMLLDTFYRRVKKKMVMVVPHAIVWNIWGERNQIVFESDETSLQCLKDNFMKTIFGIRGLLLVSFGCC